MKTTETTHVPGLKARRAAPLDLLTGLRLVPAAPTHGLLNAVLSNVYALYLKTKNFHWHMSGIHFRGYHQMMDEQATELFAMSGPLAARVRHSGGRTQHAVNHIARLQRALDGAAEPVQPLDMLCELREDNRKLAGQLRAALGLCNAQQDSASAHLIEGWIEQTEQRGWFLFEATRSH